RRRHTRFSRDWSSDVCSSDLLGCHRAKGVGMTAPARLPARSSDCRRKGNERLRGVSDFPCTLPPFGNQTYNRVFLWIPSLESLRSEERRVGKECRFRWVV